MSTLIHDMLNRSLSNVQDVSHWKKTNEALGSVPGGIYHDPYTRDQHYVKFYPNEQQARTEVATAHIYSALGVDHLNPTLIRHSGQVGVATKWRDDIGHGVDPSGFDDRQKVQLAKHLVAATITGNPDTPTGMTDHGSIVATKLNRAMRGPQGHTTFGPDISQGPQGHTTFGPDISHLDTLDFAIEPRHMATALRSSPKIDHIQAYSVAKSVGLNEPAEHAHSIGQRMLKLRKLYGVL